MPKKTFVTSLLIAEHLYSYYCFFLHVLDTMNQIELSFFTGAFSGLGFLALYLSGKIKVFDRRGHIAKLCLVFLPLLCASLVGISRVDDYWHHWQDVFAGGLLGLCHIFNNLIFLKTMKKRESL